MDDEGKDGVDAEGSCQGMVASNYRPIASSPLYVVSTFAITASCINI